MKKLRISTVGISGGRSLTWPLRDARRFPSTRWYPVLTCTRTPRQFGICRSVNDQTSVTKPYHYDAQLSHQCIWRRLFVSVVLACGCTTCVGCRGVEYLGLLAVVVADFPVAAHQLHGLSPRVDDVYEIFERVAARERARRVELTLHTDAHAVRHRVAVRLARPPAKRGSATQKRYRWRLDLRGGA